MSLLKQSGEQAGLEARVVEARNLDNLFRLYAETFQKKTGLFLSGYGGPSEYSYAGYTAYIAELKKNIELLRNIIQYLDGEKNTQSSS
jgi:hypothetical protein